jgi:predicted nucleic acid-binding Zn ribbon protein
MLAPSPDAQVSRGTARAPVIASPRASCEACGARMAERKGKRACSGKCRAVLSRRRRDDVRDGRDREVRALLEAALRTLGGRVRFLFCMGSEVPFLLFAEFARRTEDCHEPSHWSCDRWTDYDAGIHAELGRAPEPDAERP